MNSETRAVNWIGTQLHAGLAELEREAACGRYNTMCIQSLARAARLLNRKEIAARALGLLQSAPDGAFWAGAITNLPTAAVPIAWRTVETFEVLEKRYPLYDEKAILERIKARAKTERHLAYCIEGRFLESRSVAASELCVEEVGSTLAILGEFENSLAAARDSGLTDFRKKGMLLVLAIELFRRERMESAENIVGEMNAVGMSVWDRGHLALGFAGRVPWCDYPYPDW